MRMLKLGEVASRVHYFDLMQVGGSADVNLPSKSLTLIISTPRVADASTVFHLARYLTFLVLLMLARHMLHVVKDSLMIGSVFLHLNNSIKIDQ